MTKEMYAKLKEDLASAIKRKDIPKIEEIKNILQISEEQEKYLSKGLTGFPSIDKVWLKNYKEHTTS